MLYSFVIEAVIINFSLFLIKAIKESLPEVNCKLTSNLQPDVIKTYTLSHIWFSLVNISTNRKK